MLSLTQAIHKFFGRLPGQGLQDFAKEIRALSQEDKNELSTLLSIELGEEVTN